MSIRLRKEASYFLCVHKDIQCFNKFDSAANEEVYLPVTGDFHVLTGRDCTDQTGHYDFEVRIACSAKLSWWY